MEQVIVEGRPVYVLGAGFSRAVSSSMPLTDELGDEVKERLNGLIIDDGDPDSTFEDWLSLRVAELPFLQGWEVSRRRADAERVVAEIASVLDERVDSASSQGCPAWLIQLVSIWHAERAVVITFNYDTLVERAINEAKLIAAEHGDGQIVFADQIVNPAPAGPPAVVWADAAAPSSTSFTLLKLHGSINWYWSAGDNTGATLVRTRERALFNGRSLVQDAADFGGTRTLDRFLIPPVSTKNEYYAPYLAHTLWRSAYQALRTTNRLTLMGYSMPKSDQIGTQLLSSIRETTAVNVVDVSPGNLGDTNSLAYRASRLGPQQARIWDGRTCVDKYVSEVVQRAGDALRDRLSGSERASVMIAFPMGSGLGGQAHFFTVRDKSGSELGVGDIDFNAIERSSMPPTEMSFNLQAQGTAKGEEFMTVERLRAYLGAGHLPIVQFNGTRVVAVNATQMKKGNWNILLLGHIPLLEAAPKSRE